MKTLQQLRRMIVVVVGFTVLAIGVAMIVLPGPAFIVIPTGLTILAAEFVWARNLLKRMKDKMKRAPGEDIGRRNNDTRID
ncbi:MAG: PGPGW domain-containing protein [Bacteroidetes bacterium]|nr:PGPGW domain-containing protein [Bacteroidota bacterium]